MRKWILISVCIPAAVSLLLLFLPSRAPSQAVAEPSAVPAAASAAQPIGWLRYDDPSGEFSFLYPLGAQVTDGGRNPTDGSREVYVAFDLSDAPGYQGLSLRRESNPSRLSLAQFSASLYTRLSGKPAPADLATRFQALTLAERPALQAVIPPYNAEVTYLIAQDQFVYLFSPVHGPAVTTVTPQARALFEQVVQSFRLGTPPPPEPPAAPMVEASTLPVVFEMHPPLGFRDRRGYGPHLRYNAQGTLVEDTRYGIKNPDMSGTITCFGLDWALIYHAGEDDYRRDGATAYLAEVTAVADGKVVYAYAVNYPGSVIITQHLLPTGQTIYSMYGHLNNNFNVRVGQSVTRGQRIGEVMYQRWKGRDDSHIHWEMRFTYDMSNVYPYPYGACNGIIPGRGYTYPSHPDNFPTYATGYRNPSPLIYSFLPHRMPTTFR